MRSTRIQTFYEEHKHRLFTYAYSITRDHSAAEDAVHTAICRLLSVRVLPLNLKPYAYRCIRNAAIDEWRKNGARQQVWEEETSPSVHTDPHTARHDIEVYLNSLTPDEREVILLKLFHGLTFREISGTCRESIHTVSSRYRRSIEKLKARYLEEKT